MTRLVYSRSYRNPIFFLRNINFEHVVLCKECYGNISQFSVKISKKRNGVFVTNYGFLISISLQPNALDLRFTPSGGKNIGIRKSEFVTKTQFLCLQIYFLGFEKRI